MLGLIVAGVIGFVGGMLVSVIHYVGIKKHLNRIEKIVNKDLDRDGQIG
jgi:hypothetical protein